MNREELKRLWFSLPIDENKKDYKVITVDYNNNPYWPGYGTIEITRDTKNGYSSFSTHQENPFLYLSEREEFNSGEYELIIK